MRWALTATYQPASISAPWDLAASKGFQPWGLLFKLKLKSSHFESVCLCMDQSERVRYITRCCKRRSQNTKLPCFFTGKPITPTYYPSPVVSSVTVSNLITYFSQRHFVSIVKRLKPSLLPYQNPGITSFGSS